jgi:hypothetical protein
VVVEAVGAAAAAAVDAVVAPPVALPRLVALALAHARLCALVPDTMGPLNALPKAVGKKGGQRRLQRGVDDGRYAELLLRPDERDPTDIGNARKKAFFRSCAGPGASGIFSVLLGREDDDFRALSAGHSVSNEAFRHAIELQTHTVLTERVGLPPICVCGAELDVRGLHLISCNSAGTRTARHNKINQTLSCVYKAIGIAAEEESEDKYPGKGTRPDNVLARFGGKEVHVDVVVAKSIPDQAAGLRRCAVRDGQAAKRVEAVKRGKYDRAGIGDLPNTVLLPFAVEDAGRFGGAARKHIHDLAAHAMRTGVCEPWFFYSAYVPQLNAALMEGNMIHARTVRKKILEAPSGIAGENIDAWAGGPPAWFVNADGPMGMMDAFAAEEVEEEEEEEEDDDEEGPWGV